MSDEGGIRTFRVNLNPFLTAMYHAMDAPDQITKDARMLAVWHLVCPDLADLIEEVEMSRRVISTMHLAAMDRNPESGRDLIRALRQYDEAVFLPEEKAR